MNDIDNAVKKLCADELVNYQTHIGGGYYVSVTSGYKCVDFRKFYMPYDQSEMKPTNKGIALHIDEWIDIKPIIESISRWSPSLTDAVPCYMRENHPASFGCRECYPFV